MWINILREYPKLCTGTKPIFDAHLATAYGSGRSSPGAGPAFSVGGRCDAASTPFSEMTAGIGWDLCDKVGLPGWSYWDSVKYY